MSLPGVSLAGVVVHAVSDEQAVETILGELECGRGGTALTLNLDDLHRCGGDLTYRATVAEADLALAGGMPLVWASRLAGTPLPERVAGDGLVTGVAAGAARAGRRAFVLGGESRRRPGVVAEAADELRRRVPRLNVVGHYAVRAGFEFDAGKVAEVVERLRGARPDVVFVAMDTPRQELLINQVRRCLPGAWWLGVGGSFDFLTGHAPRAPRWMRRSGLEWAYRLARDPRGLFRRYVVVGAPFAGRLMTSAAAGGLRRRLRVGKGRPAQDEAAAGVRRRAMLAGREHRAELPSQEASHNAASVELAAAAERDGQAQGRGRSSSPAAGPVTRAERTARPATPPRAAASAPASGRDAVDPADALRRLRAMVLLAGRMRPSALTAGAGRPVLELPIGHRGDGEEGPVERLIDGWLRWGQAAAEASRLEWLPTRVVVNDRGDAPAAESPGAGYVARPADAFAIDLDAHQYRGTGGVLRDLAADYGDDDLLLVCNAHQVLLDPLSALLRALGGRVARGADVALVAHDDGTPGGPMLLRCGALRKINAVGYVDMKEQALPRIADAGDVRVVRSRRATGLPIRDHVGYVAALAGYHRHLARRGGRGRGGAGPHPLGVPLAEDFSRHFALIEPGGEVDASAYLHDSVVLAGGRVEAGSAAVRSVVCPGGVVRRDARAVDRAVVPGEPRGRRLW